VLEGGYSIEGALPYVNAGIIMAMAGLDYSNLREPDYEPQYLRQPASLTRAIERTCDEVMTMWRQRTELRGQGKKTGQFDTRSRQIFYDTDNIFETQEETIRICDDCGGSLRIDSVSGRRRILGVHIPRNSCQACREQGLQWYEGADSARFRHIFLQDRVTDRFIERK